MPVTSSQVGVVKLLCGLLAEVCVAGLVGCVELGVWVWSSVVCGCGLVGVWYVGVV